MNEIKYRALRCAKELAAVPIQEVAKIAATLMRDGKTAPGEATTRKRVDEENPLVAATADAFELLEIAYYGNLGLVDKDSYEAGLNEFVEGKWIDEEFLEGIASLPKWEWKYDEHGKKLPVPFDKGIAVLIPRPGVKARLTADERMTRFKAFVADVYRDVRPEQDEQELMIEVGERVAEMRRDGIPPQLFERARIQFDDWWGRRKREQSSLAGKAGAAAKEGNPEAAKSRSKPKRKRKARPPVEELQEIVQLLKK